MRRGTGSPCRRSASRTVRRRSGRRPRCEGRERRVRRRGGSSRSRAVIRRTARSSSGVQSANARCRSTSAAEATSPMVACSSSSSPASGVDRAAPPRLDSASADTCAVSRSSSSTGRFPPRKYSVEHLVVDGEIGAPAHQRGAARPVEVGQVGGVERGRGGAVGGDVAGPDGQSPGAQRPPEPDEDGHHALHRHAKITSSVRKRPHLAAFRTEPAITGGAGGVRLTTR